MYYIVIFCGEVIITNLIVLLIFVNYIIEVEIFGKETLAEQNKVPQIILLLFLLCLEIYPDFFQCI